MAEGHVRVSASRKKRKEDADNEVRPERERTEKTDENKRKFSANTVRIIYMLNFSSNDE